MACRICGNDVSGPKGACPDCEHESAEMLESDRLGEFVKWFEKWETDTEIPRQMSERDEDYYDGLQLTDEETETMVLRGQPPIVKNRIAKKINFLVGNEIANRSDPKALPRTETHDSDVAAITDGIRYVVDDQNFDKTASRVYKDMLCAGYGASIVDHVPLHREGPSQGAPEFQITVKRIPWDRFWWDIRGREIDYSDCKYMGIETWWHKDQCIAHYEENIAHKAENWLDVIDAGMGNTSNSSYTFDDKPRWVLEDAMGDRLRVSEIYYLAVDPETKRTQWHLSHFTKAGFIVPPRLTWLKDESGNHLNPITASTAYITREGVRYGPVRNMIGPQDEINKRSSKMLHHVVAERMTAEEDAVLDVEKAREERAKPDGMVIVANDALKEGRVQFDRGLQEAQAHHTMLQEAKTDIDQTGPEIPSIGSVGAASSGRALQQRQMLGQLEIASLLDNHRNYRQSVYGNIWHKIRNLWTNETWVRVRDDPNKRGFRFVGLNRRMTKRDRFLELIKSRVPPQIAMESVNIDPVDMQEISAGVQEFMWQAKALVEQGAMEVGQVKQQAQKITLSHPAFDDMLTATDVANLTVDILVEETPDVAVVQHEELQELRETLTTVISSGTQKPGMVDKLILMIVKAGQLRNKQALIDMLEEPPDPQQVQAQQQQTQLQMAALQAQVQVLMSQAALNESKAQAEQVDAQVKVELAPSEQELNEAQALKAAADAGNKSGEALGGG